MNPFKITYPDSDNNSKLYTTISNNILDKVRGGGFRTDFELHKKGLEDIDSFVRWIMPLVPLVAHNFSSYSSFGVEDLTEVKETYHQKQNVTYGGGITGFKWDAFNLDGCWAVMYPDGEGVKEHNHFPYPISFCYYVNFPFGSSPIIFENYGEIYPNAGDVIFFPGHEYHSVPYSSVVNNNDQRCVISGNFSYLGSD